MTDVQREAYDGSTEVSSDPLGLLPRDNRNHKKKQDLILDHTLADHGDRVLEVGCGHGLHAPRYAKRFDYLGVDLSPSLVDATQDRIPSGDVRQMDATDLELESSSVDAVVGTAILHHLEDQFGALCEWMRVTRPGGSITLMEPNAWFPKDYVGARLVPEERHKARATPSRIRGMVRRLDPSDWTVEHRIFSPPWPESAAPVYDRIDDACRRIPLLRAGSQMILIHIEC